MEAATERPFMLRRYPGERVCLRRWNDLRDQFGQHHGQAAQSAFLPGPDHSRHGAGVKKRRARAGKGDSAPGAFQAACDRPGGRRSAARAERATEARQALAATLAKLASRLAAGRATQG